MTSSTVSFSQKRHDYIKDWPNIQPFQAENEYKNRIDNFKKSGKELFLPHPISYSSENYHNIAVSFIIDSLDVMHKHPNFAFDFIFRAFDQYAGNLFNETTLKGKLEKSIDEWTEIINQNDNSKGLIEKLLKNIPQITCQYLYSRIFKEYDGSKPAEENEGLLLKRLLKVEKENGKLIVNDEKMKRIVELSFRKFGFNEMDYANSIRKGSRFFFVYFNSDSVNLSISSDSNEDIPIKLEDKLHLLVNGILFTMRNDRAHGASSSSFKSSKASLRTYAHNHFCFISIYFLLHLLMIDTTSSEMDTLIEVMNRNVDSYAEFYKEILGV
ncbi:hypothetical protein [Lysinibacillus piscis]|uniref:Uncharacterized protein n=1 Tax=Lysinibacillus piscis TaxID=2518931 RepID=A0ABQ5NN54_9BACI|nr:hypothetical protein [Lysinibacillus sp. KH24]GLC89801.1 hypothetical protein LYSBPC_29280 [Lysinibacillus sp. KH24]